MVMRCLGNAILHLAFYALLLTVVSCAPAKYDIQQGKIAKFYVVASWYGPEFQGRPTASGETFDMNAMTCAHKEYPFGTRLRVTNTANGKSAECIVNDRGPFVKGRDVDLSLAAARKIDLVAAGTAPVLIEVQGRDNSYIKTVKVQSTDKRGPFAIQVGSFADSTNAVRLKTALGLDHANTYIQEVRLNGTTFHRVRVGNFGQFKAAMETAERLGQEGYTVLVLTADIEI